MKPQQLSQICSDNLSINELVAYNMVTALLMNKGALGFSKITYLLKITGEQSLQDAPTHQKAIADWKEVVDKEILEQESIYAKEKESMDQPTS
jgi:hypothetical protein